MKATGKTKAKAATPWVTLHTAAKLLGVGREAVLMLGVEGKLVVEKRDHWVFVSRDSIDSYKAGAP